MAREHISIAKGRPIARRPLAWLLSGAAMIALQSGCADDLDRSPGYLNGYMNTALVSPQVITPALDSSQQLDQLVAPIALYPDPLVAQILAAATYPTEIVEAERWMRAHPTLRGSALAGEVNQQAWNDSVKALTQFPAVLSNMDQNLSWTSALGDAYANQPEDVMDAIQAMRRRAQQAGHLDNNANESVTTEGSTIVIEPADPGYVYLPDYDPWLVYGAPVSEYPGWAPVPDLYLDGAGIAWGLGFGVVGGFDWGWHHWSANWHDHSLDFDRHAWVSRSPTFANHEPGFHSADNFGHPGGLHGGGDFTHFGGSHYASPFGLAAPHDTFGMRTSAFSGFDHGGFARENSFRGQASMGGFHNTFHSTFAGGFHGGGFHGGGGGRR